MLDPHQMQGGGIDTASDCQKSTKSRRKARWKLKFHHQALPAEYLDHYEASLGAAEAAVAAATASNTSSISPTTTGAESQPPGTKVSYHDLPYMGEMTLDNARPRRGRKPKKQDICHLIYKNYGTTVVDEPLNLCLRDLAPPQQIQEDQQSSSTLNLHHSLHQTNNNHVIDPAVSMCKFKFTAGPVPSLQEKRSLALDRRYYDQTPSRKKSRKSLARERLEQTFKERGFLIQTQHLESAQGATYCKFRQLKKFTRYLFRSWKHHLPGEVVANSLEES